MRSFSILVMCLLFGCHVSGVRTENDSSVVRAQYDVAPGNSTRPMAYLGGQSLTTANLLPGLLEASGDQILSELVIDFMVRQRLGRHGLTIGEDDLEIERQIMKQALSEDPDEASRLLTRLRARRGLGEVRFQMLLRRNAGLRKLVQDQIEVNEGAIRKAFELKYGSRYQARLIMTSSISEAADVSGRANDGESFIDLAINHSTDSSRAQGGLLPTISPYDATFPMAVRNELRSMVIGQISDPIPLENGFAILKLEGKIDGQGVSIDDVKEELTLDARRFMERIRMSQLARILIREADLIVLDASLGDRWLAHKERMLQDERATNP